MAQFDRLHCFPDQQAPDPGRDRDRNNDRNDDGVRYFEDYDDRSHGATGCCANHRSHSDDRGRGNCQTRMRKN